MAGIPVSSWWILGWNMKTGSHDDVGVRSHCECVYDAAGGALSESGSHDDVSGWITGSCTVYDTCGCPIRSGQEGL